MRGCRYYPCVPEREDKAALSRQFIYYPVRDCYINTYMREDDPAP